MEEIFNISALTVLYTFVGYPLLLALLAKLKPAPDAQVGSGVYDAENSPAISIVIAAHNEEVNIERRIDNLLSQNYPLNKLQIIVGSDGSNDATVPLLEQQQLYAESLGVAFKILAFSERCGKPRILNEAISHCVHELVLFADVRQTFSDDVLRNLSRRFQDPTVGAVSGELFLREPTDKDTVVDMGAYWRYEKRIRKLEARVHSTVGATGAIYAIRKSLFKPIPDRTLIDDVVIPMQICQQGYRVLFAEDAHAYDVAPTDASKEWLRKVRTLAGNWQLIVIRPQFFNPFKDPVWLQFMSHKILRLTLPFALIAILIASMVLNGNFYEVLFILQCLIYTIGVAAIYSEGLRKMRIPGLIYFFCILNAAILVGLYRLAAGKRDGLWSFAYKAEQQG